VLAAPLPKFEGLNIPAAPSAAPSFSPQATGSIQPQMSGSGPIRVPPLVPAKAAEYAGLFEKSGAVNGVLSGENAKEIFEKARLPNEVLGRIWNLSDTEQRGALNVTEFTIAMHLLASYRTGNMKALPNALPPGLYEAASRRGQLPPPPGRPDQSAIPRQFSGQNAPRQGSPLARPPFGAPPPAAQPTGSDWLISPQEKSSYDNLFKGVDTTGRGFITGDQAVRFFSDSGLPEDVLAGIWDLADINSEGQLSRDEFAVAMYLIRQQRKGDALPTTLPPSLIPPSLRTAANQAVPVPAQAAPPAPQPKSAADDLFGLDAFTAPTAAPAQAPQSTGGSASFSRPFDNDPFASKAASPTSPHPFQPSPRNPASTFKPFMPSSSFGQTLTSHSTGQSGTSQSRAPPSAMDDLLGGETDAEINKKLTQDSTELANMSNQMTTLRTQMQEVSNKKVTTASDLNSVNTQKRDLEIRLTQFKNQYEQEVKAVKELEERLASSRNETRKLQQDLAMIEGTIQDLQNQHRQVGGALEADQRENSNLKERIRQINIEIGQLRPQLDKMRNEARQQKGMVAINKKQLTTNEGEREKLKSEMNELSRAPEEGVRSPQAQTPSVVSPAASVTSQSTNPFFRKSPAPATENTMSPSGFARDGPHKDFDSVFGAFGPPQSAAPSVSFRPDSQNQGTFSAPSGQSVRSSEGPDVPTPSTSPPLSSYQESPRGAEPPAPPESRQFASAFLPLRDAVPRSDSFGSSVKVSAPGSRHGVPGTETPTISKASPASTPVAEKPSIERADTSRTETDNFNPSLFDRTFSTASPVASVTSDAQRSTRLEERNNYPSFGPPSQVTQDLPGAFPRDTASPLQQMQTGESNLSGASKDTNRADPFGSASGEQPRVGGKVDFDAAFAGFGPNRQNSASVSSNGPIDNSNRFNKEFPPIEDLAHDDDSDSNDGRGFDDNFTSASPHQKRTSAGPDAVSQPARPGTASTTDDLYSRPAPASRLDSTLSDLPTPGAQKSPPSYESTVPQRSGSNQFPPEFGGLLPSRDVPGSPTTSQGPEKSYNPSGGHGAALFGGPQSKSVTTSPPPLDTPSSTVPSDAYHSAVSYGTSETNKGPTPPANVPQLGRSAFNDDFDAGFDDLTEAKEDDKTDDDFMFSSQRSDGLDEFNPVFDSPAASKSNTMASQQTPTGKQRADDSFSDFEHLSQHFGQPQAPQPSSSNQDWDAIFSNLESSSTDKNSQQASTEFGKSSVFDTLDKEEAAASSSLAPQMPQLGRAISTGTEHDDPILKKLTGMGYARNDALDALEKFDYDINKVS
jgi:epidermal growth factor receptor substrate 15